MRHMLNPLCNMTIGSAVQAPARTPRGWCTGFLHLRRDLRQLRIQRILLVSGLYLEACQLLPHMRVLVLSAGIMAVLGASEATAVSYTASTALTANTCAGRKHVRDIHSLAWRA